MIIIQTPNGKLYPRCGYCNGSGKMTRFTSTSDEPSSAYGTLTKQNCAHCKGKGYDVHDPIKIQKVKS